MKFIVFGIGNYGASLATKLVSLGHEVIGVDNRMDVAEKWKNQITHTITLDATVKESMQTLPLRDVDVVVVGIGETPGVNIMVTALLKQLGVKRIICRVINPLQKTVLEAMGIKEFAYPEEDSAERMAHKLDLKGVMDSYKITDDYQIIEVEVPQRYLGTKVSEINFVDEYEIQLITVVKSELEKNILGALHNIRKVQGVLPPDTELKKGDTLLLFGEVRKLEAFIEY